jgi:hypothetical protein
LNAAPAYILRYFIDPVATVPKLNQQLQIEQFLTTVDTVNRCFTTLLIHPSHWRVVKPEVITTGFAAVPSHFPPCATANAVFHQFLLVPAGIVKVAPLFLYFTS